MSKLFEACSQLSRSWNDYWFTPRDAFEIARLRVAVSVVALVQFVVYFLFGAQWIGQDGLLNRDSGLYLIGNGVPGTGSEYRWSPLFAWDSSAAIQGVAIIGVLASLLLILGIGARVTGIVAWVALLCFQNRAPMLAIPSDPLLSASLFYLILDNGRLSWQLKPGFSDASSRVSCNLALRLLQVHLVLWIAFSCLSMLGNSVWWTGEAVPMLTGQGVGYLGSFDAKSWSGQLMTHAVIAIQVLAIGGMLSKSVPWLGGMAVICFATLVLLITADWMYAATLVALSVSYVGTLFASSSPDRADRN